MQFIKENGIYIDKEIKCLLDFIRQWEKEHSDEELVFITLPKYDQNERKRILQSAIEILGHEEFSNTKDDNN